MMQKDKQSSGDGVDRGFKVALVSEYVNVEFVALGKGLPPDAVHAQDYPRKSSNYCSP